MTAWPLPLTAILPPTLRDLLAILWTQAYSRRDIKTDSNGEGTVESLDLGGG